MTKIEQIKILVDMLLEERPDLKQQAETFPNLAASIASFTYEYSHAESDKKFIFDFAGQASSI